MSGVGVGCASIAILASIGFGTLSPGGAGLLLAYALLMTAICPLAAIVPARRTLSIHPTEALKAE